MVRRQTTYAVGMFRPNQVRNLAKGKKKGRGIALSGTKIYLHGNYSRSELWSIYKRTRFRR